MRNLILHLVLALVLVSSTPVLSDTSQGDGARLPLSSSPSGYVDPVTKFTSAAHSTAHISTLTPAELREQQDANRRYHEALRRQLIEEGGVLADELPAWVATHPTSHTGAFGRGHQMGSDGGSQ